MRYPDTTQNYIGHLYSLQQGSELPLGLDWFTFLGTDEYEWLGTSCNKSWDYNIAHNTRMSWECEGVFLGVFDASHQVPTHFTEPLQMNAYSSHNATRGKIV